MPVLIACLVFLSLVAPGRAREAPVVQTLSEDYDRAGGLLFEALAAHERGNFVFSPYAAESALAPLYAGAAGDTAHQIAASLGWRLGPEALPAAHQALEQELAQHAADANFELATATRLWARRDLPLRDTYRDRMAKALGASLELTDFGPGTAEAVNRWAADATRGLIPELVTPRDIPADAALIDVAVLYLKAAWAGRFVPEPQARLFYGEGGSARPVPMFRSHADNPTFAYSETKTYQAISVPYSGGKLAMLVVMPKEPLHTFEKGFDAGTITEISGSLKRQGVALTLPKFEVTTTVALDGLLRELGVTDLFDAKADLSGIASGVRLHVARAFEKVRLEVDERGTEAAAAAFAGVTTLAYRPPPQVKLVVDHPFLFVIHTTDRHVPLFMGRIAKL
jgi:serpin B